jgi:hypothetical protein
MGSWEDVELAYRYGWEAATWPRFAGRSWQDVTLDLERGWGDYQRASGRRVTTEWEGFKKAVQDAYERAASTVTATPAPARVDPIQVVHEFLEAYNSKGKASLDTIMNALAPDAEITFSPVSGPIRGDKNLRAAFTGLFADEAGTQTIVSAVTGGPDVVAAEWIERGRNYRTAEDVLRHVAGFFEMRDGKIGRVRLYSVRVR